MYSVVLSSKNLSLKMELREGAKNHISDISPLLTEKSSIVRRYLRNSASGSFSELLWIPKAQEAMTSVVYLVIISVTSTGVPANRKRYVSCCVVSPVMSVRSQI
jgi:hypothetical protein